MDIIQNLKTHILQLLMLVWFSGSDNTLLEPGRGLTSSLSSPKAFFPHNFCSWYNCNGFVQWSHVLNLHFLSPFHSPSSFLLYIPFFSWGLFFFPSSFIVSIFLDSYSFNHHLSVSSQSYHFCTAGVSQSEEQLSSFVILLLHPKIKRAELENKSIILHHCSLLNRLILLIILAKSGYHVAQFRNAWEKWWSESWETAYQNPRENRIQFQ